MPGGGHLNVSHPEQPEVSFQVQRATYLDPMREALLEVRDPLLHLGTFHVAGDKHLTIVGGQHLLRRV